MNNLQLTPHQLQVLFEQTLEKPDGLNTLLSLTLNALMKSERNIFLSDKENNKGNGYRNIKGLGIGNALELAIPRDRLGLFKPLLLSIMKEQNEALNELCFELYANGLTTRQIESITASIYGKQLSKSSVSRITEEFYDEMKAFRERQLESDYPIVYLDATYVKTKRERVSTEAYYVALAVKKDMTREVIGIYNSPTESAYVWNEIFNDFKQRGLKNIGLMVIDDLNGLDSAIERHFNCRIQKCVLHLKRQILRQTKKTHRNTMAEDLADIFRVGKNDDKNQIIIRAKDFYNKWKIYYRHISIFNDIERLQYYITYLNYEEYIQNMIYTTNWIERLNKAFKRTLKIRNSMPSIDSVLTLMSKVAIEMEQGSYKYPVSSFVNSKLFS